MFYLPPYAPEYNPDELFHNDLKPSVGQKVSHINEDELEHNGRSHLKILQLNLKKLPLFPCYFTFYAA